MTPPVEPENLNVTKQEEYAGLRQTIMPRGQGTVLDELMCVLKEWREKKATGEIRLTLHQGGIRSIFTDEKTI